MHRLRRLRHLILDLDGTVYLGMRVFPWSAPFLETIKQLGIGYSFVTNNNSRSTQETAAQLTDLGIDTRPDQVYTSSLATIDHLKHHLPEARRLFLLGTPSLQEEFRQAGFVLCANAPTDEPEAVLVAFDTTLGYDRLCRAAWWIKKGKPFIATHPDRICPTDLPICLVDCGAITSCLAAATGRQPDVVLGKPHPAMIRGIMERHRLQPHETAIVGDRVYTDMQMALSCGVMAILVLSGETGAAEVKASAIQPDLVVENLEQLGRQLVRAK